MNNYNVAFKGRLKGAEGITYQIHDTVQGDNIEDALLNLYDKYDHIMFAKFDIIKEVEDDV